MIASSPHATYRLLCETAFAFRLRGLDLKIGTQQWFGETLIVATFVALLALLMSSELGTLIGLAAFELATSGPLSR